MRGPGAMAAARFGARLAGAHDAGKVVLLAIVETDDAGEPTPDAGERGSETAETAVTTLKDEAGRIETRSASRVRSSSPAGTGNRRRLPVGRPGGQL